MTRCLHAAFSRGPNLQRQPFSAHLGCSSSHSAAIIWPSTRQATPLSTSTGGYSSRQTAGDAARQTRRIKDVIKTSPSNTLSRTLPFKVVEGTSLLVPDMDPIDLAAIDWRGRSGSSCRRRPHSTSSRRLSCRKMALRALLEYPPDGGHAIPVRGSRRRDAIDRLVLKAQGIPDLAERVRKIPDQLIVMKGCRRNPKPLCPARNSRIVDRLNIDGELLQEQCRRFSADIGIAHRDWNDVRLRRHHWDSRLTQCSTRLFDPQPVRNSLSSRSFQMSNTSCGGGRQRRRHRRGEDEARCGRADRITNHGIRRDVPSRDTKAFGQGPFNDVNAVHDAVALGNARTTASVEPDSVDFVQICESAELLPQIANALDWSNISVHGVERFEGNYLRAVSSLSKQYFEVAEIVVPEDAFFRPARPDASDQRGMVLLIGQDQTLR